jgi:hypothetical protein
MNIVEKQCKHCGSTFQFNYEPKGKSRFSKLLNSNACTREVVASSGQRIDVVYMNDFYDELRRQGLYHTIANLEHRDYAGTQHFISKRS